MRVHSAHYPLYFHCRVNLFSALFLYYLEALSRSRSDQRDCEKLFFPPSLQDRVSLSLSAASWPDWRFLSDSCKCLNVGQSQKLHVKGGGEKKAALTYLSFPPEPRSPSRAKRWGWSKRENELPSSLIVCLFVFEAPGWGVTPYRQDAIFRLKRVLLFPSQVE